jgi:hypothetical protein
MEPKPFPHQTHGEKTPLGWHPKAKATKITRYNTQISKKAGVKKISSSGHEEN